MRRAWVFGWIAGPGERNAHPTLPALAGHVEVQLHITPYAIASAQPRTIGHRALDAGNHYTLFGVKSGQQEL